MESKKYKVKLAAVGISVKMVDLINHHNLLADYLLTSEYSLSDEAVHSVPFIGSEDKKCNSNSNEGNFYLSVTARVRGLARNENTDCTKVNSKSAGATASHSQLLPQTQCHFRA